MWGVCIYTFTVVKCFSKTVGGKVLEYKLSSLLLSPENVPTVVCSLLNVQTVLTGSVYRHFIRVLCPGRSLIYSTLKFYRCLYCESTGLQND